MSPCLTVGWSPRLTKSTVLPETTANRRKSCKLRFLAKITATIWFFFALALTCVHAQVTVSANLTDGTGATYRTAYLHFQLLNWGDNFPAVPSNPGLIIQDSFDIHPTLATGLVTGTITGNGQILCGNVASTTEQRAQNPLHRQLCKYQNPLGHNPAARLPTN